MGRSPTRADASENTDSCTFLDTWPPSVTFHLGFLSLHHVSRTWDTWLISKDGEQGPDFWCLPLVPTPPQTSMFVLLAVQARIWILLLPYFGLPNA